MSRLAPAVLVVGFILLASCVVRVPEPARLDLSPRGFADLQGWRNDAHDEALAALRRSCVVFEALADEEPVGPGALAGTAADWRAPCAAAGDLEGKEAARVFFERWFTPYLASDRGDPEGLFTGYYEPLLSGARAPGGRYVVPIHGAPAGLVGVDLGRFDPELRGRWLFGRVEDGELRRLPSRAEIDSGALGDAAPVLAWVDDAVEAFFLHVQGSGRIRFEDGAILRVGYAGGNGHAYVSIGRALIDRGALAADAVSLQSIRAWLAAHPNEAASVMALNPSYVFFRALEGDGPVGAQKVALTPGRSLAVDRRFLPLGVPLWLDITVPSANSGAPDRRLRRLVVAQDTGGAIRGPVRGDLFWGFGADAESIAGRMKHTGRYYLLLPHGVVARRVAAAGG